MQQRLRHSFGRRGLRLLLAATMILAGAVGSGSAQQRIARAGDGYVYNAPGTISGLASNGTSVAAFVSTKKEKRVVLWRPGNAPVTAPATPAGSRNAEVSKLGFKGANVLWYWGKGDVASAVWNGRGKVHWHPYPDIWSSAPPGKLVCVRGGCVQNGGHSLVFIGKPARDVYIAPGAIYSFVTDGTRVAALISTAKDDFVVLWRPGTPPVTAAHAAKWLPGNVGWLHFKGATLVWSEVECGNDCYEADANWTGRGKVIWTMAGGHESGDIGPPDTANLPKPQPSFQTARVKGGRVENCGSGLFFIPDR